MNSLPLFHRLKGTKVVVVGEGEEAEAKIRLIKRAGGIPCSEAEAHHAKLAFVALEDEAEAVRAAARLKERGLIVNVVDRPHLCEFTTPSLCEREPVLIAVGTGGASAGLAKHVRLRIEKLLPANLGALADSLAQGREKLRMAWPDGAERRRALDEALSEGGTLDVIDPHSAERFEDWLDKGEASADRASETSATQPRSASPEPSKARTEIIRLQTHDPDDLTLRQARWLGMADLVLHAPDVPEAILIRARADAIREVLPDTAHPKSARLDDAQNSDGQSSDGQSSDSQFSDGQFSNDLKKRSEAELLKIAQDSQIGAGQARLTVIIG
jgi:uroporphyrin-III C-methyltransferase/precorrin-2 dehydrogenase/sirohydrochlorin ferrochelatase